MTDSTTVQSNQQSVERGGHPSVHPLGPTVVRHVAVATPVLLRRLIFLQRAPPRCTWENQEPQQLMYTLRAFQIVHPAFRWVLSEGPLSMTPTNRRAKLISQTGTKCRAISEQQHYILTFNAPVIRPRQPASQPASQAIIE